MGSTVSLPTTGRSIAAVAALVALMLILAACTATGGASAVPGAASPAAQTPAASDAPSASASTGGGYSRGGNDDYGTPSSAPPADGAGSVEVVASSGAIGPYLTGANGATLYTFKPDSANTSTCVEAACVGSWPPLTVAAAGSVTAGPGVTGALTTFARPDGSLQVAYDGRPLYYYSGDAYPGDTNGQGRGDKWFIAAP
jgi:predicted lipoprotein with Yx(FWY)xxD motif